MGGIGLVAARAPAAALLACTALGLLAAPASATPPSAVARAWLVENPATGEILDAHGLHARLPIASITKLMTLIVALGTLKPDQIVRVDPRAAAVGQESIYLTPGQEISVDDLVKAALIQSANDAADALALAVAPSLPAFAALMNAKARELGLADSHFVRPDGLDARGEYSSAWDATLLARAAMRIPLVARTVDQASATIADGRVLHTWNDLLGVYPGVFGVKTGHTSRAGWCQVLAAREQGATIYVTVLGSPTRAQRDVDLERLLAYGLAQYRPAELVSAHRAYAEVELPYGRGELALVAAAPVTSVIRLGRALRERVVAPLSVALPVRAGQPIGSIEVFSGRRLLGREPLRAARAVAAPGLLGRLGWYARRTVHDLVGFI